MNKINRQKWQQPQSISSSILASLAREEPKTIGDMADAMRSDYQVSFAERVLKAKLEAVKVTVSTDSEDPRAIALAEKLQELWQDNLSDMAESIGNGRVAFEKIWDYDPELNLHYIRKLEPLPFRASDIRMNDTGCFDGITLRGKPVAGKENKEIIPVDKAWWLALDGTAMQPHGRSRFVGATKVEYDKRLDLFSLQKTHIRKFCLRGGVAYGPATIETENGEVKDYGNLLSLSYKEMQAGGVLYIPQQRDRDGNLPIEFTETAALNDPSPIDAAIDKSDVRVLRSFGISELSVQQTGDLGSFAMSVMHQLVLNSVINGILRQFTKSFDKYVCKPSLDPNWYEEDQPELTVSYPDMTVIPDSIMVELAKGFLTSGQTNPLIAVIDAKAIFEAAGIPIAAEFEDKFQKAMEHAASVLNTPLGPVGLPSTKPVTTGPVPAVATTAVKPATPVAPEETAVQDTALNGAQIASLMEIIARLSGGLIPPETAKEVMKAAFPAMPEDRVERIIQPMIRFQPTAEQPITMSNVIVAPLPSQAELNTFAEDELRKLFIELYDTAVKKGEITGIVNRITDLMAELKTAARTLGMLSPWLPQLTTLPEGSMTPEAINLSNDQTRFPWMEDAVNFLQNKEVVSAEDFAKLAVDDKLNAFSIADISDTGLLKQIKEEITAALTTGENFDSFADRLGERMDVELHKLQTVYRTNTKQAYTAGQEAALSQPAVEAEFPYVMLSATDDTRVREEHWAVDGYVVRRGTPEHRIILAILNDWNCRCGPIPMSEDQALLHGIKTLVDFPSSVLQKYGIAA